MVLRSLERLKEGYNVPEGLQNICVKNFKPNLMHMSSEWIKALSDALKAHYHASYIEYTIDSYGSRVTASEIYDINQLEAMQLANDAWDEVDTTTIRHCWHKPGILPDMDQLVSQPKIPVMALLNMADTTNQLDPITEAEKEVEEALDQLQSTGVLQSQNRMTIEALLNPYDEIYISY
ncbi:hypothetical protein J132_05256 [Termitomyces sp. J132]|nr:hypothetical protein C0989_002157 [Termitomyces sp. Mn162]KAH0584822.1 hypothetical protein H2248_008100 [Termitomyces sp. 'cryptogamus']KNZ77508.1 hypothetical protein J132_05256 [Termitomyces sp. J132]